MKQKDQKFKADIIGPNAQSGRFPAMSAEPTHPTQLGFGIPAHGVLGSRLTAGTSSPFTHTLYRHGGLDPPSPKPQEDYTLIVASRHREERSDPFMTGLCKICF